MFDVTNNTKQQINHEYISHLQVNFREKNELKTLVLVRTLYAFINRFIVLPPSKKERPARMRRPLFFRALKYESRIKTRIMKGIEINHVHRKIIAVYHHHERRKETRKDN